MPNYRRAFVPGGTFFFLIVTYQRRRLFSDPAAVRLLGDLFREVKRDRPFDLNAIVLLPDHLHTIWTLPSGDTAYSARIGWVKKEFTKKWRATGGHEQLVSAGEACERRGGVWQPRFWEHTCEDTNDFDRRFDYVHFNPVRHGYVTRAADWPHSSFHRWVRRGIYNTGWGTAERPPDLSDLDDESGEP